MADSVRLVSVDENWLPPGPTVDALTRVAVSTADAELVGPHITADNPHPSYDGAGDFATLIQAHLI